MLMPCLNVATSMTLPQACANTGRTPGPHHPVIPGRPCNHACLKSTSSEGDGGDMGTLKQLCLAVTCLKGSSEHDYAWLKHRCQ
jgi:hypothetical protein